MSTSSIDTIKHTREHLAIAAGAALLVAGLLLVAVVMPAEYGIDPFGTGATLGLTELGATAQQVEALNAAASTNTAGQPIVAAQERPFQNETVEFKIAPGQGMEYKYRLEKGEALLFSWTATAPVNYELHAEPDGAPRGYAQSYEKENNRAQASGTLTAPFPGIHGWYWENTTDAEVTVSLTAAGFYNLSHEFQPNQPVKNKTFP
jgi:hypothetical protein